MAYVLVGGKKYVETGPLRFGQQVAVGNLSHPRSRASVTVWPMRKEINGDGVLWSNRTSMKPGRG